MISSEKLENELHSYLNKSHKVILNRRGPMEPWGTPYNIPNKSLKEEPTLVF